MQLNVYIPKDKEYLLEALAEEARRTGRSKNTLVLEALEQQILPSGEPAYRTYSLEPGDFDRASLYEDRLGCF